MCKERAGALVNVACARETKRGIQLSSAALEKLMTARHDWVIGWSNGKHCARALLAGNYTTLSISVSTTLRRMQSSCGYTTYLPGDLGLVEIAKKRETLEESDILLFYSAPQLSSYHVWLFNNFPFLSLEEKKNKQTKRTSRLTRMYVRTYNLFNRVIFTIFLHAYKWQNILWKSLGFFR